MCNNCDNCDSPEPENHLDEEEFPGEPPEELPEQRKIIDTKKVFSTINKGHTLRDWPSAEIKAAAGADGWDGWAPEAGMLGTVLKSLGNRHLLRIALPDDVAEPVATPLARR